jgi:glycosyltransferase involved in cell wall biosynthesis
MRILFISDFSLTQRAGGAQVSNDIILKKGRQLGHDITEHNHSSSITDFLSSYDLVINSNLEMISKISPEKINYITKFPNSVRLEHDSCSYLNPQTREDLFGNCVKTFFLSDFHYSFFKDLYGDFFKNVEIVYDPIDVNLFRKIETQKVYDVVYCGYLHPLKGVNNLINYSKNNPDRQISVFGWGDTNPATYFENQANIDFKGVKPYEEIASVFQQAKAVFHAPIVNEPFCRMIGEAILCGVEEVIGSTDKIGAHLEFQKVGYDKFNEGCGSAAEKFWSKILKI